MEACAKKQHFFNGRYEEGATLGARDDIFVEATRVILNEQFDRIDELSIAEINGCRSGAEVEQIKSSFEETIVKIHENQAQENISNSINIQTIFYADVTRRRNTKMLIKKYFEIWRKNAHKTKETPKKSTTKNEIVRETKIEEFVRRLKKQKKRTVEKPTKRNTIFESADKNVKLQRESYKNRFEAQKHIIEQQKAKLNEQKKIIEELKLGKMHDDIIRSMKETEKQLKETHSKCSVKTKCKRAPIVKNPEDSYLRFIVNTKKAPKMVQKMQERAEERARRHEIILARKRLIDENKRRQVEEALEKKRAQDEEEKRRNLAIINERRRLEMEAEKIRKENRRIFAEALKKARDFHKRKLLKKSFGAFLNLLIIDKLNIAKSDQFYTKKLKQKIIWCWLRFIEEKYRKKNTLADNFSRRKLTQKYFKLWRDVWYQSVQSMQVAEDLFDMRLQTRIFAHWHWYVYHQSVRRDNLMKKAIIHYRNHLLFQYFYQWRSLPAVLQLEKAKEEKKKKWRRKVMEILPDYKPPQEFLFT